MNLQAMLDNAVAADRAKRMAHSDQLTLGEIVAKLSAVSDKTKLVRLDFGSAVPVSLDSWRGIYAELALEFDEESPAPTSQWLLDLCRETIGKTLTGYKGGDYFMSRHTPVWVSNYGVSEVPNYRGQGGASVAVIDVVEADDGVLIVTAERES